MKDDPVTYIFGGMLFVAALLALMVTLFAVMEFFDGAWGDGLKMLGVAMFLWGMVSGYGWFLWSGIRSED